MAVTFRTLTMCRILLAVLVTGVVLVAVVAGYRLAPHLPHLTVTSTAGLGPREWNIDVTSGGSGRGVAAIVVQWPDGHRSRCALLLVAGAGGGPKLSHLSAGRYRYAVYAVTVNSKTGLYWLPARDLVAKSLVDSGSFTIR